MHAAEYTNSMLVGTASFPGNSGASSTNQDNRCMHEDMYAYAGTAAHTSNIELLQKG